MICDHASTSYVAYLHRNVDETGLQALVTLFLRHPAYVGLLPLISDGLAIYPLAVAAKNEASPQQAAGYHKEGHCL